MVLSKSEIALFSGPFKQHIEKLLKLQSATPECVIWFLAGCLQLKSLLHLRQMSLFGMLSRLQQGDNPLANHARYVFSTAGSKSWFHQVQATFLQYSLPHPVTFLDNPRSQAVSKARVKSAVIEHWETKLRGQASLLTSLKYFKPSFMSLSKTHPIFSTCGSSKYEISKAIIQAQFLSGRARVETLTRHWDPTNREGFCSLCKNIEPALGSLEHILLSGGCPALADARLSMISFINSYLVPRPHLLHLFKDCWEVEEGMTMQFLLDCSVIPAVIKASQELDQDIMKDLFYITRTYVFTIYLKRRKLLETA